MAPDRNDLGKTLKQQRRVVVGTFRSISKIFLHRVLTKNIFSAILEILGYLYE